MALGLLLSAVAAAKGKGQVRGVRAAFGSMVIEWLVVGVLALFDASRAGNRRAAIVTWSDGSTALLERIAVDVGKVVIHLALFFREGVLELGNVVLGIFEGKLDGDTAAIVVCLILFRVLGTGFDDFALINGLPGNRPNVDGLVALILDNSPSETRDNSRSEGSEGGSSEDGLGIHLVVGTIRLNNEGFKWNCCEGNVKIHTRECVIGRKNV